MPITISIVEDHHPTRKSLTMLINGTPGLQCVGTYPNAETALAEIPHKLTDVVLMDMQLPILSGVECVRQLKAQHPSLKIIMLTVYEEADGIFSALMAGADGYLLKGRPMQELVHGIQNVCQGGAPMSSEVAARVVRWFHQQGKNKGNSETTQLTSRESEILGYLSQGLTYKDIASTLCISVQTANSHIKHIYEKLHVHSRHQAIAKHGVIIG